MCVCVCVCVNKFMYTICDIVCSRHIIYDLYVGKDSVGLLCVDLDVLIITLVTSTSRVNEYSYNIRIKVEFFFLPCFSLLYLPAPKGHRAVGHCIYLYMVAATAAWERRRRVYHTMHTTQWNY